LHGSLLVIGRVRVSLHVIRLVRGVLMATVLHVLRRRTLLTLLMWTTGLMTATMIWTSTTVADIRLPSVTKTLPMTTSTSRMSTTIWLMATSTGLMTGPGGHLKARRCHMCSRLVCTYDV